MVLRHFCCGLAIARCEAWNQGNWRLIMTSDRYKSFLGAAAMNLSDKFHNHAQECQQQMAQSVRDVADKATWSQIAERWQACAKYNCQH